jgi:hypothetical protein
MSNPHKVAWALEQLAIAVEARDSIASKLSDIQTKLVDKDGWGEIERDDTQCKFLLIQYEREFNLLGYWQTRVDEFTHILQRVRAFPTLTEIQAMVESHE